MSDASTENKPYLTKLPITVKDGWLGSHAPYQYITCDVPSDVRICVPDNLNRRIIDGNCTWSIYIVVTEMTSLPAATLSNIYYQNAATNNEPQHQLRNVALISDDHRNNFFLTSVYEDDNEIGTTNGQEWYYEDRKQQAKRRYRVEIEFYSSVLGTYRQNVIYYFGRYPVFLQRLCVDFTTDLDHLEQIQTITEKQKNNLKPRWADPLSFSPLLTSLNENENNNTLSKIYPSPNEENLFFTQDVLKRYETKENYRGRLHELITLEEIARIKLISEYNLTTQIFLLPLYKRKIKKFSSGQLYAKLSLNKDPLEETKSGKLLLYHCQTVLLKKPNEDDVFEAYIDYIKERIIYLRISKICVAFWHLKSCNYLEVEVKFTLNLCQWHWAVDRLEKIDLMFPEFPQYNPTNNNIIVTYFNKMFRTFPILSVMWHQKWHDDQTRAIYEMIKLAEGQTIFMTGFFGSGKTFIIAYAITCLLLEQCQDCKILLCARNESAADCYIIEYFNKWQKLHQDSRLRPVRLYNISYDPSRVDESVLEYCLKDECGFRKPKRDDLTKCHLIVTTVATAIYLTQISNLFFSHVFIDEATWIPEFEILLPLTLTKLNARLVMAGDSNRFESLVYNNLEKEIGLRTSFTERLNYPWPHQHRICLIQNCCTNEDILIFVCELNNIFFYFSEQQFIEGDICTMTFYSVLNEGRVFRPRRYVNETEATEMVKHVLELKNVWPTNFWGPYERYSIAILTCYTEQVIKLQELLMQHNLSEVFVEKACNVEGRYFTAVFISTVCSNIEYRPDPEENNNYGFLTNESLTLAALSKAKKFVAVVGNPVTLLTQGTIKCKSIWSEFVQKSKLCGIGRTKLTELVNDVSENNNVEEE